MSKNNTARMMTLSNGIRVVIEKRLTNKVVFIFLVGCGSRNDPKNIVGVSHATEHMMFEGTPSLTARDILILSEGAGAIINAMTSAEDTIFFFESSVRDFERVAKVYGEALNHSSFNAKDWLAERSAILEERQNVEGGENFVCHYLDEQIFGLREGIIGSPRTIKRIKPKDMREMVRHNYRPENIVISIAGGVEYDKAFAMTDKLFRNFHKSWDMNEAVAPYPYFARMALNRYVEEIADGSVQTSMAIEFPGYTIYDIEHYALRALSLIVGRGSSSRLYLGLRDKRSLVYFVDATALAEKQTGGLQIVTMSTRPKETIRALFGELKKLADSGVTEEELNVAKRRILAARDSIEDSYMVAEKNALDLLCHGRIIKDVEYASIIEALTVNEINRVAREVLVPSQAVMAVIGHKSLVKEASKILAL